MRPSPRRYGAFSLLELVLVLALVTTMSTIAMVLYTGALVRYRADLAARRIASDLMLARAEARNTSSRRTVVFDVGADRYQIQGLSDLDRRGGDYETDLADDPYKATLVSADFGGASQVVFDGFGDPDEGGVVVVRVGTEKKKVVLDQGTRKVTVQ